MRRMKDGTKQVFPGDLSITAKHEMAVVIQNLVPVLSIKAGNLVPGHGRFQMMDNVDVVVEEQ